MSDIIKFNTSKGDVYIETTAISINPSPSGQNERNMNDVGFKTAAKEQMVTLAKETLDKSLESLSEIADKIAQKVKVVSPDKVEIEFGFKISGTGDLFIAKCTTEGNFTIKLTWEK